MSAVTLTYLRNADVPMEAALSEAHRAVGMGGAVVLLLSPDRCQVGRVDEAGAIRDATEHEVRGEEVFELRAFSPDHELRWTRHRQTGTAMLLGDDAIPDLEGWTRTAVDAETLPDHHYLLLGRVRRTLGTGWVELAANHIRPYVVPGVVSDGARMWLCAREYVRAAPEHGNVYVCEERLLGLEAAGPPVVRP